MGSKLQRTRTISKCSVTTTRLGNIRKDSNLFDLESFVCRTTRRLHVECYI